jgi:cytochrome b
MQDQTPRPSLERRVWDLPVRLFHWSLALAVLGAWVTHELGTAYFVYHLWCGYAVLLLVGFRIVWGLIGTRHARFVNFLHGPAVTLRYALDLVRGRELPYAGHNPLGAWMVVVLLLALLAQAILGLFGNDEILNFGPLYGYISNELSLKLTSVHRQLFDWILAAVALHIAAVAFHRFARSENLVRAMFSGRKPAEAVRPEEEIQSSRVVLAIVVALALAALIAWVVIHAPIPAAEDFGSVY